MSLYSVLLVDDEEDVIQVIMKKMDWEAIGFRVAGYASNGIEALEMAEELQVDVVMSDIKMPYMDGLTLCRELKHLYNNIKVIIFSGFDEFEYAREAIKIEAEEYILKPVNSVELAEVFERIKTNLDKERDEKQNIAKLKKYYAESLPVLQDNFLFSLINGSIPKEKIEKYALNYQIDLSGNYYSVTVLHLNLDAENDVNGSINPLLLSMSVKRLVEEQLKNRWQSYIISHLRDIIILTKLDNPDDNYHFTDDIDRICSMAKRVCLATVTAGVGYICEDLDKLIVSYEGAKNALSYRVLYGSGVAINIEEVEPRGKVHFTWEESGIQGYFNNIKFGKEELVKKSIAEMMQVLKNPKLSIQQYYVLMTELLAEIFRFGSNNQLNLQEIFGEDMDAYAKVLQMESIDALEKWLADTGKKMLMQLQKDKSNSSKTFVNQAIEYVKNNYASQDITIDEICNNLGVSSAYFSTVFKKETGKTFIQYLTDYRMEIAVDILMNTDEKTYIIAEKIGYSDPNYFSYVFKKKYGVSPSKYKTENL